MDWKKYIRQIPDFPKPGILFRDITPLLAAPEAFQCVVQEMMTTLQGSKIDAIVAIESRGFIIGAPLACQLNIPFVPVRKPGKLPAKTYSVEYALEYGSGRLELHTDALQKGMRVAIVDDLLATGGTAAAAATLVKQCGASVAAFAFIIELAALKGRALLSQALVHALVTY